MSSEPKEKREETKEERRARKEEKRAKKAAKVGFAVWQEGSNDRLPLRRLRRPR
jgi:hypothetical protein